MGAVGGAATGVVRARVAVLDAATGAVGGAGTFPAVSRTFPPRTTEVATQTDHMVFPFVFPGGGWTL